MRVGWWTDLHLNRMDPPSRKSFIEKAKGLDHLLISGDISNGKHIFRDMSQLSRLGVKTHYVLGNHDYYWGALAPIRHSLAYLPSNMNYLTESEPVELSASTILIGDDGWYDARATLPLTNLVFSIDWLMIGDFWGEGSYKEKLALSRELAWASRQRIITKLRQCIDNYERVIIVTHIPPWRQRHRTFIQDRFWTPYNTNHYLGESIEIVSKTSPLTKIMVLSGHTHIENSMKITERITCRIGTDRKLMGVTV
jgi:predicted phosphohydrolase